MEMNYILFTHGDLDGVGCEVVFRLYMAKLGSTYSISHGSHEETNDRVRALLSNKIDPKSTVIYFSDISPEKEALEGLLAQKFTVRLYDHHPTASWVTEILPTAVVDTGGVESGTSLLARHIIGECGKPGADALNNELTLEFIDTVRAWDTWEWSLSNRIRCKYLSTLFQMLGYDRFAGTYIDRLSSSDTGISLIEPEHQLFIDAKIENQQELIDKLTPDKVADKRVFGYRAAIIFSGTGVTFSDGASQFLRKYPQYDIMVNVNLGMGVVNYRSIRNDINLGELAANAFGGGGHPRAAGNSVDADLTSKVLDIIFQ